MLYLLAFLAVGNAAWTVSCPQSAADQACCNLIGAHLIGKPTWPCMNDGSDGPGQNTAQYAACHKCAGINKMALRPFLAQKQCMSGNNIDSFCEAIPTQGGGAPVVPTPTKATPKPATQKPATNKPDGPSGTRTSCNQHLVDTCCQWGGNKAGTAGYVKPLGCSHCLANGMNTGLRKFVESGVCGAPDISFYCQNPDWDHQMNAAKAGTFTVKNQAYCTGRYPTDASKKPPVSITQGIINPVTPVGPPAAVKCLGLNAIKCPSHCTMTNKVCVDLNGACDQGSVSQNKQPSKNASKICKQIKGCAYNQQLSTCAKAAPAPTPTPGGGSCTGKGKKACKKDKNCDFVKKKCQTKAAPPAPGTPCAQIQGSAYCKAAGCQYKKKKCSAKPVKPNNGDDCSTLNLDKKTCRKTTGCSFAGGKCTGIVGAAAAPCNTHTTKAACTGSCKWRKGACK